MIVSTYGYCRYYRCIANVQQTSFHLSNTESLDKRSMRYLSFICLCKCSCGLFWVSGQPLLWSIKMCSEISFFASFFPKGVSLVWKWFLIPLGCSLYSTLYPEENCCFIVLRQNPAIKPRLAWNSLCSEFQADFEFMAVLLSHLPHESFIHVFIGRRTCIPWHLCGGQRTVL